MSFGNFPTVSHENRVYVDVDDGDGFVYVRHVGGTEIQLTDAEAVAIASSHWWIFHYSAAALERVQAMLSR